MLQCLLLFILTLLSSFSLAHAATGNEYYEIRLTGRVVCPGEIPRRAAALSLWLYAPGNQEIWVSEASDFLESWAVEGPVWRKGSRLHFSVSGQILHGPISLNGWMRISGSGRGTYVRTFEDDGCYEKGRWRIKNTLNFPADRPITSPAR